MNSFRHLLSSLSDTEKKKKKKSNCKVISNQVTEEGYVSAFAGFAELFYENCTLLTKHSFQVITS